MTTPSPHEALLAELDQFRAALYDALLRSDAPALRDLLEQLLFGSSGLTEATGVRKIPRLADKTAHELLAKYSDSFYDRARPKLAEKRDKALPKGAKYKRRNL